MIQLFVGLGNPGTKYDGTRHNAGFDWLETTAHIWNVPLQPAKNFHGLAGSYTQQGKKYWLLQPHTFMNRSGLSVAALARFYKIAPENILVVHDELDLAAGQIKLKQGGSHAGHNGLRDIHAQLGNSNYWRLKIGIGHPGIRSEVINWVLKKPAPQDKTAIEDAIAHSMHALSDLLAGNMDKATRYINTPAKK